MSQIRFAEILAAAEKRKGGSTVLREYWARPEEPESLAMVGDDRYLSVMSRRIFRAGLKHSMVDDRWPAFEDAFDDFDPDRIAAFSENDMRALHKNEALIRHKGKLNAVRANAQALLLLRDEAGSMGNWLAGWPSDEIVELWDELKKRFTQLGGQSGPRFLRMAGKDTFLLTDHVLAGLAHWNVYTKPATGKRAAREIQVIFNDWMDETDLPLCQLSQTLSMSVDV